MTTYASSRELDMRCCVEAEASTSPCAHLHAVMYVQEVVGVEPSVVLHLLGQGPDPPVCQLVALVSLHNQPLSLSTSSTSFASITMGGGWCA